MRWVKPLKTWLRVDSVPPLTLFWGRVGFATLDLGFAAGLVVGPRDMAAIVWWVVWC